MEDINKFIGGINSDVHPSAQPEHTTRYMLNFVAMTKDGNLYSVMNENGTSEMNRVVFPDGFQVIGHTVLNNDIIVVLAHPDGYSQIGYIVEDDNPDTTYLAYHPAAPALTNTSTNTKTFPLDNSEMGFTLEHPVVCEARKLIDGHRLLYFTDNNIPFGKIDLDNPPEVGTASKQIRLISSQEIPNISITEIKSGPSTLRGGVVQFITRYVTKTGGVTNFGIPTNPLAITPKSHTIGVDQFDGAFYEDGPINKQIVLSITNLDITYNEVELIAISYEGGSDIFKATRVARLPIASDSQTYTYEGEGEELLDFTLEELRKNNITYEKAKCLAQKDNILFLSNLTSRNTETLKEKLQRVANNIKVSYKINEIPYSGRGDNIKNNTSTFLPYATFISDWNEVTLRMNQLVDETGGNNSTNPSTYLLYNPNGKPGLCGIGIADNSKLRDGQYLYIDVPSFPALTQVDLTFTAKDGLSSPAVAGEFLIGVDETETMTNLKEAIDNHPDRTQFSTVQIESDEIFLVWEDNTEDVRFIQIDWKTSLGLGNGIITDSTFRAASAEAAYVIPSSVIINSNEVVLTFNTTQTSSDDILFVVQEFSNFDITQNYMPVKGLTIENTIPSDSGLTTFDTSFTDYVDEKIAADYKTFRRNEVYSLGFSILWVDGTRTEGFHIPGTITDLDKYIPGQKNESSTWPSWSDTASEGKLGTYVSELKYPLNQHYPGNLSGDDISMVGPDNGRNIRHHLMPSLKHEPHFRKNGSQTLLRLLSLKFEFQDIVVNGVTTTVSDYLADIIPNIKSILFIRERRNKQNNKSIVAQGVINNMVISADSMDNDGIINGIHENRYRKGYFATEMPFFNNLTKVKYTGDYYGTGGAYANGGLVWANYSDGHYNDGDYENGRKLNSDILLDQMIFHSPETNLESAYKPLADLLNQQKIKPVMKMTGSYKQVNFKPDTWKFTMSDAGFKGLTRLTKYLYADYFGNYDNYLTNLTGLDTNGVDIQKARYLDPGRDRIGDIDSTRIGLRTNTRWTAGGLELKTQTNVASEAGVNFQVEQDFIWNGHTGPETKKVMGKISTTHDNVEAKEGTDLIRNLYNLELTQTQQYGSIDIAEYIIMSRKEGLTGNVFNLIYEDIYGGDTFIGKFAINTANLINYFPIIINTKLASKTAIMRPKYSNTQRDNSLLNMDDLEKGGTTSGGKNIPCGWDLRTCTYYFVESDINVNYRHEDDGGAKDRSYYPNNLNISTVLNAFNKAFDPNLGGDSVYYNNQYSYENNIITIYPRSSTESAITEFENRTIYSEQASEDDTLDTYQSFLQSNYYDLPSDTGPIWNSFVMFGDLFLHTTKALWKTFAEPAAILQAKNISDVVLGTGSLFARPSQKIVTEKGGYGGTISQWGGISCPLGYLWVDVLQGKIFGLIGGESVQLKELSQSGISVFMNNNLPKGIITNLSDGSMNLSNVTTRNAHLIDNPYQGIGVLAGYDHKLRRVLFTKFKTLNQSNVEIDPGFTISFSTILQNWFSFHSYQPEGMIGYNDRFLLIKNLDNVKEPLLRGRFYEMNLGNKGDYFGTVYDSELEFVSAQNPLQNKVYQNIIIGSQTIDPITNYKVRDNNFENIQCRTDRMNTGLYTLISGNGYQIFPDKLSGEVLYKWKNDEYRIAIPRDAVVDNADDLENIDWGTVNNERIKGDCAHFKFIYRNILNYNFVLKYLRTIFNLNIR